MIHIAFGVFLGLVGAVVFLNWLAQRPERLEARREARALAAFYKSQQPVPVRGPSWSERTRLPPICVAYAVGFGFLLYMSAMLQ